MEESKNLGFLGILFKAHKAEIGEVALAMIPKSNFAFLAYDASENSLKKAKSALMRNDIKWSEKYSKSELGHALGYDSVSLVVVLDKKAAEKIVSREDNNETKKDLFL